MHRNRMTRVRELGAVAAVVALGLAWPAMAQQTVGGDSRGSRVETRMTPAEVGATVRNAKHSLADSISAAEKHCGGRAVRAECCSQDGTPGGGALCVVTLLVGQERLVEAVVDAQSGAIVRQRDVRGLSHFRFGSDEFAMARTWQKSSDLTGKRVTNAANEDLGRIEDIVVDAASGRILYGVLSFGGIFGVGDKLFAIPWQTLPLSGDAKAFVLNVEKDRLKSATTFDKRQWPNFADEQFATATYRHYDQTPYWNAQPEGVRAARDGDGRATGPYRDRWYQRTTIWQKASDLRGKDVRNHQGVELGEVDDLVIDPENGRVLYAILESHGRLFAIPWPALTLSSDYKQLVLNVTPDQLKDSVSFDKHNWPNLVDEHWADETHRYYNVQPYWTNEEVERPVARP